MRLVTKDLYEAAYLLSKGMKLSKVLGSNKSVLLIFEGNNNLDVLKNKYREGKAEANILKFKSQMRDVKDIVFSVLREIKTENKEVSYCLS